MALPKKKTVGLLPNIDEVAPDIRKTTRWQFYAQKLRPEAEHFKTEEAFYKYIDRLCKVDVDQNNLASTFQQFKPKQFDSLFKKRLKESGLSIDGLIERDREEYKKKQELKKLQEQKKKKVK